MIVGARKEAAASLEISEGAVAPLDHRWRLGGSEPEARAGVIHFIAKLGKGILCSGETREGRDDRASKILPRTLSQAS